MKIAAALGERHTAVAVTPEHLQLIVQKLLAAVTEIRPAELLKNRLKRTDYFSISGQPIILQPLFSRTVWPIISTLRPKLQLSKVITADTTVRLNSDSRKRPASQFLRRTAGESMPQLMSENAANEVRLLVHKVGR